MKAKDPESFIGSASEPSSDNAAATKKGSPQKTDF